MPGAKSGERQDEPCNSELAAVLHSITATGAGPGRHRSGRRGAALCVGQAAAHTPPHLSMYGAGERDVVPADPDARAAGGRALEAALEAHGEPRSLMSRAAGR